MTLDKVLKMSKNKEIDQRLNVRPDTIKLPKENRQSTLWHKLKQYYFVPVSESNRNKPKNKRMRLNQNYKLLYSKGDITKWKDNLQNGREYCEWSDWQRGLSPGYTNSSYSLISKNK